MSFMYLKARKILNFRPPPGILANTLDGCTVSWFILQNLCCASNLPAP